MKNVLLRTLLVVCAFDVLLGLVLASYALFGEGTPKIWRGALLLLTAGACGVLWFWAALRRQTLEVGA
jgi:hypothetical protein